MIRRLTILLLIVGCATKRVENRTSIEYTMKMSEDEFKTKNNELEIYEQNKEGIVYKQSINQSCEAKRTLIQYNFFHI